MHRFGRYLMTALVAGGLLPGAVPAQAQDAARPLVIGSTRLFTIRTGDTLNGREMSVSDRINHLQDIYAKYLGGQQGKITWKKWGDRVHLYLNGEFVLAVTPADARATHHKTVDQLAPTWAAALQQGFDEAHVRSAGSRR